MAGFADDDFLWYDYQTGLKHADVSLQGATSSKRTTLAFVHTLDRTVTFPDGTTTLAGIATTHTITGAWTFDANTAVPVFSANAASTQWADLLDSATGNRLYFKASGAIAADADLTVPAAGGKITTCGTVTSGRVAFFSGTTGLLGNDADMSFSADTLTVTKIAATTFTGNITISTKNIVTDTTTGTQIGTVGGAAGQKLGFFAATPIVQPLLATGAGATVDNVITALQNLGLVRQT